VRSDARIRGGAACRTPGGRIRIIFSPQKPAPDDGGGMKGCRNAGFFSVSVELKERAHEDP